MTSTCRLKTSHDSGPNINFYISYNLAIILAEES